MNCHLCAKKDGSLFCPSCVSQHRQRVQVQYEYDEKTINQLKKQINKRLPLLKQKPQLALKVEQKRQQVFDKKEALQ